MSLLLVITACSTPWATKDRAPNLRPHDTGVGAGDTACALTAVVSADGSVGSVPFTVTFTASAVCGADWVADWDFGDGQVATGTVVTHTYLGSGDYTVSGTLAREDGQSSQGTTRVRVRAAPCPELVTPIQVGTLGNTELVEASGLAEGRVNAGVLWSHNDSGDQPRLFALDVDGTDRGTWVLDGAPEGDWEDLAEAWDASGTSILYVGDIGANGATRDTSTILAVPEPEVTEAGEHLVKDWYSFELVFPDGPALDSNAMMWDPVSDALYLAATEADGVTGIYRGAGPFADGDLVPLERVAGFAFGEGDLPGSAAVTGAAISAVGDAVALRTSDSAFLWRRDQSTDMESTWASPVCPLALDAADDGEAIAFAEGGYYTTGESLAHPIWYTELLPAEDPCTDVAVPEITVAADSFEIPAEPGFWIDDTCLIAPVVSVEWSFGDGTGSTALAPSPLYLASGTYDVSADIVDADGAAHTATTSIEVLPATCPSPDASVSWGTVASDEVREASGLGQSSQSPGVLWSHNDSGDDPRLFAIGEDGADLGQYTVVTANRDWEDLTLGWDEVRGVPAIYVGDFGDNASVRTSVVVLVVPEPVVDPGAGPVEEDITDFSSLTLAYPDEAHNAETLMADPVTGDLYIVTKDYGGDTAIFRKAAPHEDGSETVLEHVADLQFGEGALAGSGATTGGDFSPLGDRIGIRTYTGAFLWRRDQAESIEQTFAGTPCDMEAPSEPQGESLAFTTDGAGYITLSEGDNQPIYYTPLD